MKYFRNTFKVLKPQSILSLEIKTMSQLLEQRLTILVRLVEIQNTFIGRDSKYIIVITSKLRMNDRALGRMKT